MHICASNPSWSSGVRTSKEPALCKQPHNRQKRTFFAYALAGQPATHLLSIVLISNTLNHAPPWCTPPQPPPCPGVHAQRAGRARRAPRAGSAKRRPSRRGCKQGSVKYTDINNRIGQLGSRGARNGGLLAGAAGQDGMEWLQIQRQQVVGKRAAREAAGGAQKGLGGVGDCTPIAQV